MSTLSIGENCPIKAVLAVFTQYGFKKASMEDLAKAIGISRQALYKRHPSKKEVFDWAVQSYSAITLDETLKTITKALEEPNKKQGILEIYKVWSGQHISTLRTTDHGLEIMELAYSTAPQGVVDIEQQFNIAMAEFITQSDLSTGNKKIEDIILILTLCSKTLLLKAQDIDDFTAQLTRVVDALFD